MAVHFNFILSDKEVGSLANTLDDAQAYYLGREQDWTIKYEATNDTECLRMIDYYNKRVKEVKKLSSIMFEDSSRI